MEARNMVSSKRSLAAVLAAVAFALFALTPFVSSSSRDWLPSLAAVALAASLVLTLRDKRH